MNIQRGVIFRATLKVRMPVDLHPIKIQVAGSNPAGV